MSEIILFDLDGTLTDSAPGITRCVQYALRHFGIDEPDLKKLECFVGPPLKEMFMEYAGFSESQAEEAVAKYRERYTEKGIFENAVYEGIPELLQLCRDRGRVLGVASSKPQVFVEQILEHFDLRQYFEVVVGAELDGTRTDKAEVIEECADGGGPPPRCAGSSFLRTSVYWRRLRIWRTGGTGTCRSRLCGGYGRRFKNPGPACAETFLEKFSAEKRTAQTAKERKSKGKE